MGITEHSVEKLTLKSILQFGKLWVCFAFVLAFVVSSSCERHPSPSNDVVAQLDDMVLTGQDLESWASALLGEEVTEEMREAFVNHWIENALLIYEARRRRLDNDPWVAARSEELQRKLMVARLLEKELEKISPPTRDEVSQYYQTHQEEFRWKDLHLLIEIYSSSHAAPLEKKHRELKILNHRGSANFQGSEDNSLSPLISETLMVNSTSGIHPSVWKTLQNLSEGSVSPVYQLDNPPQGFSTSPLNRFYLFRVIARYPKDDLQPFDMVYKSIENRLKREKEEQLRKTLIEKLEVELTREGKLFRGRPLSK